MNCPICDLRCVLDNNGDSAECPDHGVMPGLFLYQLGKIRGREAAIELDAYRAHALSRKMFDWIRSELDRALPPTEKVYAVIERSKLNSFWRCTLP